MKLTGVVISEPDISGRVREIAAEISRDYQGKRPLIIGALKGAFIFLADLTRSLTIECEIDFLSLSSYGNSSDSSGEVNIRLALSADISGRDVIIVDDILDTGATLRHVMRLLCAQNPASLKLCVLLDKPERRTAPVEADYTGFTIPNVFVVGYGMDYAEQWRGLPYIASAE